LQEEKQGHFSCRQISAISKGVQPDKCKELFERNFQKIDISQKAVFANLLKEFLLKECIFRTNRWKLRCNAT